MLFHSVAVACVSTAIIILIYSLLYILENKRYIGIWILSWICHLFKHIIMLLIIIGSGNYLLVVLNQLLALLSALFLFWGSCSYLNTSLSKKWKYYFALAGVWVLVSNYLNLPFLVATLPTFSLLSLTSIKNGILLINFKEYKGLFNKIAGFSFVLLGIHRADYPFLRGIEWFAPFGYSLGVILKFIIAISILALYLHKTRIDLIKKQDELIESVKLQKETILKLCQSEVTIKKNEEKFKALFNNMNDAAYFYEVLEDGTPSCFLEINDIACKRLGYGKQELLNMTFFDINKSDKQELNKFVREILLNGKMTIETRHTTLYGREMLMEISANTFVLNGKQVILSIARDITSRKRIENELRESETRYRKLIELLPDAVIVHDEGKISYINNAAAKLLKVEETISMIGRNVTDIIHSDYQMLALKRIRKILDSNEPSPLTEIKIIASDGKEVDVEVMGTSISINGNSSVLAVFRDITERKRMESELASNFEEAKTFQKKLITTEVPTLRQLNIQSSFRPANKVGGDIYDIIEKDNNLYVYIADVSGKGVSAAMMSTYLKASLKHYIFQQNNIDPSYILSYIRNIVTDELLFEGKFLTLFACCINLNTLRMKYSNAGHCYPLVGKNLKYGFLKNSEALISEYTKDCSYSVFEYQLEPLDKLLLYTDGIYEWKDENKFFGLKNFKEYFVSNELNITTLDRLVEKSCKQDDNHDDVSYILMEINKVVEKNLPSTVHNLDAAQDFLYYEVKKLVSDKNKFSKIVQSTSEMIINAFEHGNKYDETKNAHVSLRYNINALEIKICDEGNGFNWRDKLNMQCVSPDSVRGRGIFITNHYSEEMLYNEKGNEVTLKFNI